MEGHSMKKNKRSLCLLLVAILVLALTSCSGSGENGGGGGGSFDAGTPAAGEAGDTTEGTTLIYGSGDYSAINPALYEHGEINSLLFLGLTAHDKDNNVVPGLAETWSWNEEARTYTFTLRYQQIFPPNVNL